MKTDDLRVMKGINVDCQRCGAKAGSPCLPSCIFSDAPKPLNTEQRTSIMVAVMNLAAMSMTRTDITFDMATVFEQAVAIVEGRPCPSLEPKQGRDK